ncbi:alpha/beta hydrolase [Pendulispora rubella]|uniref:Alpha/beta hydrolase n=1 Tax=Pendulispora rubella TaxID=2741070 RepID=A0ABZ2KWB1_9BACT|nr:SrbA [Sorangiineae bacterium]
MGILCAVSAQGQEARGAACPPTCERVIFDVKLQPDATEPHRMVGSLCARGPVAPRTLQVLVHGATYTKEYWDFPYAHPRYSYVAAQTAAGFATLALDGLGTGESDRPPAERVTTAANAYAVHQIIQTMRAGSLRPDRIVLVGHSLGAAVAAVEAATYQDVDGVIFSGILHNQGPDNLALYGQLQPAAPAGYVTTVPGQRGPLFYRSESADPAVIEADERLKSTVSATQFSDAAAGAAATASIRVPVLVAVGDEDTTYCSPPSCSETGALEREKAFYAHEARVEVLGIPQMGHSLNLHRRAGVWYAAAAAWTARRVH